MPVASTPTRIHYHSDSIHALNRPLITETPGGSKIAVQFECCPNVSTIKSKQTLQCAHYSVYLFSGLNFLLGLLLLIKFFGFDLTPGCKDTTCKTRMNTLKFSISFSIANLVWLTFVFLFGRHRSPKTMCVLYKYTSITVGVYVTIHYVIYFLLFLDGVAEGWIMDENGIYRLCLAPQPLLIWSTIYMRRIEYATLLENENRTSTV